MIDEQQLTRRIYGSDNTIGLFVSLYLILLAFFIVLTAISKPDDVSSLTSTESLQTTFVDEDITAGRRDLRDLEQRDPRTDKTLNELEDIILSAFAISGRYGQQGGNILTIDVPVDYLFEIGAARMKRAPRDIMDQLVIAANAIEVDQRSDILILLHNPPSGNNLQDKRFRRMAYRRASNIAGIFVEAGIETGGFSVGFSAVGEDTIRFQFKTAPRFDPTLPLGLPSNRIISTNGEQP